MVAAGPVFADDVHWPSGELRKDNLQDLAPHPSKSRSYNELWTFVFQFDQGSELYLNFTRANLGPKDPVCGADAVLTGFRGKNYGVAREYPLKNFKYDARQKGLAVHEHIRFSGVGEDTLRAFFQTSKRGVNWFIDLSVTEAETGAVWGDGLFKLGDDKVGLFLHVPKAKVQGRIAINGDTLRVTGTAYMDHTFQTAFAPKLVRKGLRVVQHQGEAEVGQFFETRGEFKHRIIGYGLRGSGEGRILLKPESLKVAATSRDLKMKVPSKVSLTVMNQAAPLEFERKADKVQGSTLEEFGIGTRYLLKKLMGGEVYTFRGVGTLAGRSGAAYSLFVVED
jgi:hypothetical protein